MHWRARGPPNVRFGSPEDRSLPGLVPTTEQYENTSVQVEKGCCYSNVSVSEGSRLVKIYV